ncbi:unnamed protein product, partial [Pylaiella littoralis]
QKKSENTVRARGLTVPPWEAVRPFVACRALGEATSSWTTTSSACWVGERRGSFPQGLLEPPSSRRHASRSESLRSFCGKLVSRQISRCLRPTSTTTTVTTIWPMPMSMMRLRLRTRRVALA